MAEASLEPHYSRDWRRKAGKLSQAEGAPQHSKVLSGDTASVLWRKYGGGGAAPGPFRGARRTKSDQDAGGLPCSAHSTGPMRFLLLLGIFLCVQTSAQVTYSCVFLWRQEDIRCPYSLEEDFSLNLELTFFQPARTADPASCKIPCLPRVPTQGSSHTWLLHGCWAPRSSCWSSKYSHPLSITPAPPSQNVFPCHLTLFHMWAIALPVPIPPAAGGQTERMNS